MNQGVQSGLHLAYTTPTTAQVYPQPQTFSPAQPNQFHQFQLSQIADQQTAVFYPGQQQQAQQRYLNATPIGVLGRGASPVDCPACGKREMTRVTYVTGNTTHGWAFGACICFCLGCIPYLLNDMKDVQHHCGKCGVLLSTWHRSGAVEVHQHG